MLAAVAALTSRLHAIAYHTAVLSPLLLFTITTFRLFSYLQPKSKPHSHYYEFSKKTNFTKDNSLALNSTQKNPAISQNVSILIGAARTYILTL